jgi:4-hydroxy-3-methylbut-2-enyl diphosphate reductase
MPLKGRNRVIATKQDVADLSRRHVSSVFSNAYPVLVLSLTLKESGKECGGSGKIPLLGDNRLMLTNIQGTNNGPGGEGVKTLVRVRPRGFCAGVVRAVDIVELALEAYGRPVYVHHEIVHNRHVVDQLRRRGAIFVETIAEVPQGAVLVFSAHGVPPRVRQEAKERELRVIDATCPLVTKVHLEALKFAREGRTLILIGHRDHQEIVGTSGEAPDRTVVVGTLEEVDQLEVADPSRLAFLTQTTLSLYDTQEIVARLRQRFPQIAGPASDDICYATQNRQEAVEALCREVELILVVGSANSSNSNRLVEVAQRSGVSARLIEDASDIDSAWLENVKTVGLTAGASAPEILVEQVSQRLFACGYTNQRDLDLIREDVRFTLPVELSARQGQAAR